MNVDFKSKQQEFASYIRDSVNNPAPSDVRKERMDMYKQLFFNNIDSFLASSFPVLRNLLNEQQWTELAQDFFAKHTCHTPYFSEIPEEFLDYLQNERDGRNDFPFMFELAHYEWVEMALAIDRQEPPAQPTNPDNLLEKTIKLSPLAWPLAYLYPVHRLCPEFIPEQPPAQPTFLIVYRDRADDVGFLEITPITYRLLEIVQSHQDGVLVDICLTQLAEELQHIEPQLITTNGLQILAELAGKSIVSWI